MTKEELEKVKYILDSPGEHRLTVWETNFLKDIIKKGKPLTSKQENVLLEIEEKEIFDAAVEY